MKYLNHQLFFICLFVKYGTSLFVFGEFFAPLHDNLDSTVVHNVIIGRFWNSGFNSSAFSVFLGGSLEWFYFDRVLSPLGGIYALLTPKWAYFSTEFLGLLIAYFGMLTLIREFQIQKYNNLISVSFAFSLSFSSYGFGLHAAPLVIAYLISPIRLSINKYLLIFFLGTMSSYVLHGLLFPLAALAFFWIFQRNSSVKRFLLIVGLFSLGSIVASSTIIFSLLQETIYHRSDWPVLTETLDPIRILFGTLGNILSLGTWYHAYFQPAFLPVFILMAGLLSGKKIVSKPAIFVLIFIITSSVLGDITPLYASKLPAILATIQFSRIGFYSGIFLTILAAIILSQSPALFVRRLTLTSLWLYLSFSLMAGAGISFENLRTALNSKERKEVVDVVKEHGIGAAFSEELLGKNVVSIGLFQNTRGSFGSNFKTKTYSCFSNYIIEGRAITFGYDPMVAAFHGIPIIDGYHYLYPLTYKRDFHDVISKQLVGSAKGPKYFNEWGSRAYSFVETKNKVLINFDAAVMLGAQYVISSLEVSHARLLKIAPECSPINRFHLYKIL